MAEFVYAGLTSQSIDVFLQDSSSTTGGGLSGLVYNTSGLKAYYRKGATGSATAITLATQTVGGAYSSGGFVEIDATNMKGTYRLDLPNAMVDTEGFVTLYIYGATNLVPTVLRIDCRALPTDVKKAAGTAWGSGAITAASIAASALDGKGDWNVGKTGYSLTQSFPTNFASLAITVGGAVTAGTVSDKTGYSLTQAFPSNFSSLGISAGGAISTVTTLTNAPSDSSGTTTLLSLLTSTRAEYLDNLSGGAVMLASSYTAPLSAAGTRSALGMSAANLDAQLAALDSDILSRLASSSYSAPPSASAISTQVAADLATAHGSGSWATATGFALAASAPIWYTAPVDVSANVALILEDTGTTIPAQISALNNLSAAQVNAEVDTALADYDGPTNAEMVARTLAAASYATAADQSTIITHLTDIKGTTFSGSTDSLEAIRDRGDAAWMTATGFTSSTVAPSWYTDVSADVTAILEDTGTTIPAQISALSIPTANQVASAVLAAGDVDGYSLEETLKLCLAALTGKLSGAAGTTITIKAADDSKTRITATVDSDGNRSAVTLDAAG